MTGGFVTTGPHLISGGGGGLTGGGGGGVGALAAGGVTFGGTGFGGSTLGVSAGRWPSSFAISRSCSSLRSMLRPHRQQSAVISQMRTDIGALQSGQPQRTVSPSSQNRALPFMAGGGGSGAF